MNYSNQPNYVYDVLPWIPDDIRPMFDAAMIAFVIFFFMSLHYKVHVMQYLIPPLYLLRLRKWLRRWFP